MDMRADIGRDINAVQGIASVPRILSTVASITGMRFAAIARVTDAQWIACAVHDTLDFGLKPGGELVLESTICDEIRQHGQPVVFADASSQPHWANHHTTRQYGLESYISVPILRGNGEFFGTLCAIDSRPAQQLEDSATLEALQLFAQLIGTQLELSDHLDLTRSHLRDAQGREKLLVEAEREVRDLLQPIVTSLYLLRTSSTLAAEDRALVEEMERSSQHLSQLLRSKLDIALGRVETRLNPVIVS